jgi:hypothetical protein
MVDDDKRTGTSLQGRRGTTGENAEADRPFRAE